MAASMVSVHGAATGGGLGLGGGGDGGGGGGGSGDGGGGSGGGDGGCGGEGGGEIGGGGGWGAGKKKHCVQPEQAFQVHFSDQSVLATPASNPPEHQFWQTWSPAG